MRAAVLALACAFALGCASTGTARPRPTTPVTVHNHAWQEAKVDVLCDGHLVGRFNQVVANTVVTRRFSMIVCGEVSIEGRLIGSPRLVIRPLFPALYDRDGWLHVFLHLNSDVADLTWRD